MTAVISLKGNGDNCSTQPVVKIKVEKLDPAYGDVTKKKQLINPMALMRDKPTSNGTVENSLVISAVTSINPVLSNEGGDAMTQPAVENTVAPQGILETNDVTSTEKALDNLVMVQIPREFCENNSSTSALKETSNAHESLVSENHHAKQSVPMNANCEENLEALLKIYEDAPPANDGNDLFQELLKFD